MSLVSKLLGSESEGREQIRHAVQNYSLPLQERVDLFQSGMDSTLMESQGADDRHRMALGAGAGIASGLGGLHTLATAFDGTRNELMRVRKDRIVDRFRPIAEAVSEAPGWSNELGTFIENANPRGVPFDNVLEDVSAIPEKIRKLMPPESGKAARQIALQDSFEKMLVEPSNAFNFQKRVHRSLKPFQVSIGSPSSAVSSLVDDVIQAASDKNIAGTLFGKIPGRATTQGMRNLAWNPAVLGALAVLGGVAGKIKADKDQKELKRLAGDDVAVASFLREGDAKRLVQKDRGTAGIMDQIPGAASRAANTLAAIVDGFDTVLPTEGPRGDFVDRDVRQ